MEERVIYPNTGGGITVVVPAPGCGLTIEEIAAKDVPAGVPYKIIEDTEVPVDRTYRDAWEADFSEPDGYGIGHEAWFAQRDAQGGMP